MEEEEGDAKNCDEFVLFYNIVMVVSKIHVLNDC